jgi:hypothetical protein
MPISLWSSRLKAASSFPRCHGRSSNWASKTVIANDDCATGATHMDTGALSTVSALVGSIVGLSASVATSWVAQRTQARRLSIDAEIKKREALYAEFIAECSKLAIDALDHSLEHPDKILGIYALGNRIRLCASESVVAAAEQAIQRIGEQYMKQNLAPGELRQLVNTAFQHPEKRDDPLRPFSETCRRELARLHGAL